MLGAGKIALFRMLTRLQRRLGLRLTPLGRIVAGGAATAGAFGIDVHQTVGLQVASMAAGLLAVSLLFLLRFRPRLRVQRTLPDFATVGVPLTYTVQIENQSPRRPLPALTVVDELDARLPTRAEYLAVHESRDIDNRIDRLLGLRRWLRLLRRQRGGIIESAATPPVSPLSQVSVTFTLLPLRRGYVQFAQTILLRPDPLGLVNAIARVPAPMPLLVLPRRYRVPRISLGLSRRHQAGGLSLASSVGDTQEFLSLRDYSSGDPMRIIHWRSWAKTGQPIVKQFQDEYFNRQALIVDTFAAPGPCFEAAISLAASFLLSHRPADSIIDLMFIGTRAVQARAGRGLGSSERLLELLACAEPAPATDFSALSRFVLPIAGKLSACILILLEWDQLRQDLVRALRAFDLALMVIVVSDTADMDRSTGPMQDQPGNFRVVHPERIEEDLARLVQTRAGVHPDTLAVSA